jgi:hypothetical protein
VALEDGRVFAGGSHDSELDIAGTHVFSEGGADALLLQFSATGEPLWGRGFGRNDDDRVESMALGPAGALFVAGTFHTGLAIDESRVLSHGATDAFLLKLE